MKSGFELEEMIVINMPISKNRRQNISLEYFESIRSLPKINSKAKQVDELIEKILDLIFCDTDTGEIHRIGIFMGNIVTKLIKFKENYNLLPQNEIICNNKDIDIIMVKNYFVKLNQYWNLENTEFKAMLWINKISRMSVEFVCDITLNKLHMEEVSDFGHKFDFRLTLIGAKTGDGKFLELIKNSNEILNVITSFYRKEIICLEKEIVRFMKYRANVVKTTTLQVLIFMLNKDLFKDNDKKYYNQYVEKKLQNIGFTSDQIYLLMKNPYKYKKMFSEFVSLQEQQSR